jgi:hypothetical protein
VVDRSWIRTDWQIPVHYPRSTQSRWPLKTSRHSYPHRPKSTSSSSCSPCMPQGQAPRQPHMLRRSASRRPAWSCAGGKPLVSRMALLHQTPGRKLTCLTPAALINHRPCGTSPPPTRAFEREHVCPYRLHLPPCRDQLDMAWSPLVSEGWRTSASETVATTLLSTMPSRRGINFGRHLSALRMCRI